MNLRDLTPEELARRAINSWDVSLCVVEFRRRLSECEAKHKRLEWTTRVAVAEYRGREANLKRECERLEAKLQEAQQRHARYLDKIEGALMGVRERRHTGEPVAADVEEIRRLIAKLRGAERPKVVACKCGCTTFHISNEVEPEGWYVECVSCGETGSTCLTIPLAVAAWGKANDASV